MKRSAPRLNSCFWELTRRCRLRCLHCRASAGDVEVNELRLPAAMDIADQLIAMKARRVVLTGGEPILYDGWETIARRLAENEITVRLFVSGYDFTENTLHTALDAGVSQFAVSLDGPQRVHDFLRPPADAHGRSPFLAAVRAIEMIHAAGATLRVVTQANRENIGYLEEIYRLLLELNVKFWQIHLCQMTGRARFYRNELQCDPSDLEAIIRVLLLAARERKIQAPLHCTLGYMTEEEPVLRNRERNGTAVWRGCHAGLRSVAITPEGGVKGCTTFPDEFVTGLLSDRTLAEIWGDDECFPYTRRWTREMLLDECADCAFGDTCRGGCPTVAYGATGAVGANPYCLKLIRMS